MNINISRKSDYAAPWTYFLLLGLFCSIYRKYTNVFTFFREGLKFWNYDILSFSVRGILRTFSNILDGAFCWKSFCKFILFSSQIGFDIALTDIEATLKQRWNGVVQRWKTVSSKLCKGRWFNVVSMLDIDVVSILCNVENLTSDFVSFSTSSQRYFNGDPQCWNNVRRWNVGWLVSIKKLTKKFSAFLGHLIL